MNVLKQTPCLCQYLPGKWLPVVHCLSLPVISTFAQKLISAVQPFSKEGARQALHGAPGALCVDCSLLQLLSTFIKVTYSLK